jgi:hypothetical protein
LSFDALISSSRAINVIPMAGGIYTDTISLVSASLADGRNLNIGTIIRIYTALFNTCTINYGSIGIGVFLQITRIA